MNKQLGEGGLNTKRQHQLQNHKNLFREMFLYGIIGGISALADTLVFYFLHQVLNIYASNFISINIGITLSFFLNTFLNFKMTDKLLKRAISFYMVGYTGLLLSMVSLFVGVDWLNIDEMPVKICSIFIVAAFQFTLNKLITYRRIDVNG